MASDFASIFTEETFPVVLYFAVLGLSFLRIVVRWTPFYNGRVQMISLVALPFALNALRITWTAIFQVRIFGTHPKITRKGISYYK